MKRPLLPLCVVLLFAANPVRAAVNLSWNDCGLAGQQTVDFACDANSGQAFMLFGSFRPPVAIPDFCAVSATIAVIPSGVNPTAVQLSDWWKFGSSTCRGTSALSAHFDFTSGPFTCTDPWLGLAVGFMSYEIALPDSNGARIRIMAALGEGGVPVDPGTEYYAFRLNLARSKSSSTGACAGCDVPVCLLVEEMKLFPRSSPEILETPTFESAAYWHPAYLYIWDDFENHQGGIGCAPDRPTIAQRSTWGRVKSLYR
jgi:hypothetical protein